MTSPKTKIVADRQSSNSQAESTPTEKISKKGVRRSSASGEEDDHPKRKRFKASSESSKFAAKGQPRSLSAISLEDEQGGIIELRGVEAVNLEKSETSKRFEKNRKRNDSIPVDKEVDNMVSTKFQDGTQDAAATPRQTMIAKESKKHKTVGKVIANAMHQNLKYNGEGDILDGHEFAPSAAKRSTSQPEIVNNYAAAVQKENETFTGELVLQIDAQAERKEMQTPKLHQRDDVNGVKDGKLMSQKRRLSKRKISINTAISAVQDSQEKTAMKVFQQNSTSKVSKKSKIPKMDETQNIPETNPMPAVEHERFAAQIHLDGQRTGAVSLGKPKRNEHKQKLMKSELEMLQRQEDTELAEPQPNFLENDDDSDAPESIFAGESLSERTKCPSTNVLAKSSVVGQHNSKIGEIDGEEDDLQEPTPPESPQQENTTARVNELPSPDDKAQSPHLHRAALRNFVNYDSATVKTAPVKPPVRRAANIPNIKRTTRVDLPAPLINGPAAGPYTEAEKAAADDVFDYVFQTQTQFIEPCQLQALIADWSNADVFREEMIAVLPNRTLASIRKFCQRRYTLWDKNIAWTAAEDEELRRAYRENPGNWVRIADSLDRRPMDCESRWKNHVQYGDTLVTGPWSAKEEARLVVAVQECIDQMKRSGAKSDDDTLALSVNWMMVSEKLARTRSAKRCREKWNALKRRPGGINGVIAPMTGQPLSSSSNNVTSANEKKHSKEELAALRKLRCFQPGDYFDVLTEIHTALPDPTAVFHHSGTTLWSIVAQRNPDSRFTSVLRRVAFKAALDHYGTKVGGAKNVIKRHGTVAEQAKAMCESLSRWAKKEGLTVNKLGRGYVVPSVRERREALRKKKRAKQEAKEGEIKERGASMRERSRADEDSIENMSDDGDDDDADSSSTTSSSSSTPIPQTPPTPTPVTLDGQILDRRQPPSEGWALSSVRDNNGTTSEPLEEETIVPETQQSQRTNGAVATDYKANVKMAAADGNDSLTMSSDDEHWLSSHEDVDEVEEVDDRVMSNGDRRKADSPDNTNRLLWPGFETVSRRDRHGAATLRFVNRTRGRR